MKKYFILLFFILLVSTGCFDYTELNDMAIVSGISLDYEENGYHVGFEILNTVSKDDNQNQPKVYFYIRSIFGCYFGSSKIPLSCSFENINY